MSFAPVSGRGRGGYAPRRGRGGWSRPPVQLREPVKPDITKHPLGELLVSLRLSDVEPSKANLPSSPHIDDCQYVTSYNWLGGKESTILVPGQPPQWTPLKVAQKLPEDSGSYFRDPNAARYPKYPIAPAVQAIVDTENDKPIDADLFACGSTLGNLLRFVRGIDKAFRFSVEVIGDTVFLIRKENDPKELIEGVRGYGHSFPEAYTMWPKDVKGSETHQRIVQYNLGDLRCLVRFECDGFLDNSKTPTSPSSNKKQPSPPSSQGGLIDALSSTVISSLQNSTTPLIVKHAGEITPQSSIFDLKTRSGKYKKEINMDDITPALWLKQVPNFIVAYHNGSGLFEDIQIRDVRRLTTDFEKDNAAAIRRLVALLTKIIDTAKADREGMLDVYCPGATVLELRRPYGGGEHALPAALHEQWVARCFAGGLPLDDEDATAGAFLDRDYDEQGDLFDDSDDGEMDFTACSVDECGYCGKCTY